MINSESEKDNVQTYGSTENVCNLRYLVEMMGFKNHLVVGVIDTFLKQIPEELYSIDEAIKTTDYSTIKSFAHTMKSSVSIMGISVLAPILQEMQDLAASQENLERIKVLNEKLKSICVQAIKEIEKEKCNYVEA